MAVYSIVHLVELGIAVYVLYFVCSVIYLVFFHSLAKFPGPRLWAVSRIPWAFHVVNGDLWRVLQRLHEEHGPVIRIAPDELTTTVANAWQDIYASKPLLLKDPRSQTPPLNGAHSLFTAELDTHRRLRGVLSNSFSDKALRAQAPIIEKYASQMINRILREAGESECGTSDVDLTKLYGYAVFDVMTDLSLGGSLARGLEDMNEHTWIQGYYFHAKYSALRAALSRFRPLDALLGVFLLGVTRSARLRNWRVITGVLDRRMAQKDAMIERSDLLTPLIDRLDETRRSGITEAEMISNGLAFVIAGTEANTNVLSTATYLLLRHREKWEHLVEEIRGRFSDDGEITVQATDDLPYLDAVIKETLRIRHPTPINLPRIVPTGGYVINGHRVPRDAVIGINLQNIQNSTALWVEPRQFHPERFLHISDPRYDACFDADVKEAFQPFALGPRKCIGYKLFYAQVRVLLARVVWNFNLARARVDLAEDDWLDQKAWFFFEPRPLFVKITSEQS